MRLLCALPTLLLLDAVVGAAADNDGDGRRLKHHLRQQPTEDENLFTTADNTSSGRGSLLNLFGQSNVVGNTDEEVVTAAADSKSSPTNSFKETRIVNGEEVDNEDYPFFVRMKFPVICGGSLITPNIILTAGHCIDEKKEYDVEIWDGNSMQEYTISKSNLFRHPEYDGNTLDMDVALMKLDNPVVPVATITDLGRQYWKPSGTYNWVQHPPIIRLQRYLTPSGCTSYTQTEANDITTLHLIGYGTDKAGGKLTDALHYADVHYVTNEECNDQYGKGWVTDNMMCAADTSETQDSCQGDSGGPMLADLPVSGGSNSKLITQVGVVSWGFGCADRDYPGVYSRVAYKNSIDWIDEKVCGSLSPESCKEDENGVLRIIDFALESSSWSNVSRRTQENAARDLAVTYGVDWEEEVCELLGGSVDEPPNPITGSPTHSPSDAPSMTPTISRNPTHAPIGEPSMAPSTSFPTKAPIIEPSMAPSSSPTAFPSVSPSGSPSRPPGKSETKTYTTEKKGSLKTKAFMFEIVANDGIDVIIETLAIEPKDPTKMTEVTVYYQEGSYKDFADEGLVEADWGDPIYIGVPQLDVDGMSVIELDDPITIPSGETGSFYIVGKKEFMVEPLDSNQATRSIVTSDFDINSGTVTKKAFEEKKGEGEYVGKVTYYTYTAMVTPPPSMSPSSSPSTSSPTLNPSDGPSMPPSPSPSMLPSMSKSPTLPPNVVTSPPSKSPTKSPTSAPTNLPTNHPTSSPIKDTSPKVYQTPNADDPDSNAKGLMFSIVTKSKAIRITDLGIIGKKSGAKDVSIYYKLGAYSMNEDNDWTQVLKGKVSLVQEQIVKVTLDEEIVIPAGATASVYIYSKNGQLCTKAKEGDSTETDDFMLKAGWITKNEFEDLVEDKWGEFEGEIFYLSG